MNPFLIAFFVFLMVFISMVISIALQRKARKKGAESTYGTRGSVIYTDDGRVSPLVEVLNKENVELVGKPDYVIEKEDGTLAIIDLKSGTKQEVHPAYRVQLGIYRILAEKKYQKKVTELAIFYLDDRNRSSIIPDEKLEQEVLENIRRLRDAKIRKALPDATARSKWKCKKCRWQNKCIQKRV